MTSSLVRFVRAITTRHAEICLRNALYATSLSSVSSERQMRTVGDVQRPSSAALSACAGRPAVSCRSLPFLGNHERKSSVVNEHPFLRVSGVNFKRLQPSESTKNIVFRIRRAWLPATVLPRGAKKKMAESARTPPFLLERCCRQIKVVCTAPASERPSIGTVVRVASSLRASLLASRPVRGLD